MQSITGAARPWLAAGIVLAAAAASVGCGNRAQPVINPINPTGPAGVPTAYAVAISQPALRPAASATNPCAAPIPAPTAANPNATILYAQPGVATLVDFSGDSILAEATIGFGPLTSAITPSTGGELYTFNCDGTISGIPTSVPNMFQSNAITTTTLFSTQGASSQGPASIQSNALVQNAAIYVVNKDRQSVGALTAGSPPALLQEIAVAPAVVAVAGSPTSQRVYAISQGATGSNVAWGDCANPANVTSSGEADGIDPSTNALSSRIPLGRCPVFGLTTPDGLRTFILNRASGTVTVINAQQDALDTSAALAASGAVNGTITVGAGPVYAAYYPAKALLVTANYDSGTVSFISVPVDTFGNDGPGFGTVLKTVAVGAFPAALSILADGSRVYVALQGDPTNVSATGAIAIVNATSFNLQNTIGVPGHPRTIASTYNNPEGKVYVVAPDSQLLTILRTDSDTISAQLQLQGCGVDVHTGYQYAGQTNISGTALSASTLINNSNSPGSGAPTISFTPVTASLCQ